MLSAPGSMLSELSQTLQDVPIAGLIPVALLAVVGIVLWLAGRRVLRAGFGAVGLLFGLFLGWLAGETLNLGVPSWIAALFVGILLACVAALVYRLAVAGALALVFGVAAPLAVLAVNEIQGGETFQLLEAQEPDHVPEEIVVPPDEIDQWLDEDGRVKKEIWERLPQHMREQLHQEFSEQALAGGIELPEELVEHLQELRSLAERLIDGVRETWDRAPEGLRPYLLAAAVLGGLLGILVGTLIPSFSAAVITAFTGSLLWLSGVKLLAHAFGAGETAILPHTGRGWLSAWIIIAVIGLALQWIFFRKRADRSSAN